MKPMDDGSNRIKCLRERMKVGWIEPSGEIQLFILDVSGKKDQREGWKKFFVHG